MMEVLHFMERPAAGGMAVDMTGVAPVGHASASGNIRVQGGLNANLNIARAGDVNVTTICIEVGGQDFSRSAERCLYFLSCPAGPDLPRTRDTEIGAFSDSGRQSHIA